jgi:hypothetical protein
MKYWFKRLYYRILKPEKVWVIYFNSNYIWKPGEIAKDGLGKGMMYLGKNMWIELSVVFLIFMLAGCFQPPCPTYQHQFRNEMLLRLQQREQYRRQNKKLKCKNREKSSDQTKIHVTDYHVSGDRVTVTGAVLYFPQGSDVLTSTSDTE